MNSAASSFHLRTLGCKVNQYESQTLRQAWRALGLHEVSHAGEAGIIVFNSCAVTSRAVQDLRTQVRQAHRANPQAAIVITGCAAQLPTDELGPDLAKLPGVAAVLPQARKAELLNGFDPLPATGLAPHTRLYPPLKLAAFPDCGPARSRAVCKVQDGCSQGCAYCIVPRTRGPAVSREPADVLAEVRALLESGFTEVVLVGINLAHYGRGLAEDIDFWDLLQRLDTALAPEWADRARLRISSLDPAQLDSKGLETLEAARLVAPHLHISLQSLHPETLTRMGRRTGDPERVIKFLDGVARFWPRYGLGADFLTGFPGEDDEAAATTLREAAELPLTYAHVFPYSPRPGTRAAAMPDQVPGPVAAARAKVLRELAEAKGAAFTQALVQSNATLQVVVEGEESGGMCQYYVACRFDPAPDTIRARELVAAQAESVDTDGTLVVRLQQ